ncbi:MAG TPA: RDD family protein [Methylomirabilota bacterium]|nr:RDD family protein [Methylomirabilota bacterium]
MPWFYANAGQQVGPVSDADFERLAREGVVQPTTLVWREGMANWEPLASVARPNRPPAAMTEVPLGKQVICSECRKSFPIEETMAIGGATLCPACKPGYLQKLREGTASLTPPPQAMRYAGFWIRTGAYLIDYMIQQVVSLPLSLWLGMRMTRAMQPGALNWNSLIIDYSIAFAAGFVLAVLYTWLFTARYSATPGKMLVRVKVVRADGTRLSYGLALGRALGEIVSSIPCMLGFLFVAFDREKRALHDFMCDTRVIYK